MKPMDTELSLSLTRFYFTIRRFAPTFVSTAVTRTSTLRRGGCNAEVLPKTMMSLISSN